MPTIEELTGKPKDETASAEADQASNAGTSSTQDHTSEDEPIHEGDELTNFTDMDVVDNDGPDLSDGFTGPKSLHDDQSLDQPAHNADGYRNAVVDEDGNMTILDDDTAQIMHDEPKRYEQIYNAAKFGGYPVSRLRWCNMNGSPQGSEKVGEVYAHGK